MAEPDRTRASHVPGAWLAAGASFRPRALFEAAATQTVGLALPIWAMRLASERLRVPVAPLGAVHVHLNMRPQRAPLVLLVHGIGGSSESVYVVRAAEAMLEEGFHVARLDLRGAGESLIDAPSLYHAGLSEDVERVASVLARDPRVSHVSCVGFSLGGNVVLKLAGSFGEAPPPWARAFVAVSPVVDLGPAATAFARPQALPYRVYVLRKLVAMAAAYARRFPDRFAMPPAASLSIFSTIREYDARVVVPMHGFGGVDDYYERASSAPHLKRISTPTLVVFAEDDPMIPAATVIGPLRSASRHVEVAWTRRGGHVGGYESVSRLGFVRSWPTLRALEFLRARA